MPANYSTEDRRCKLPFANYHLADKSKLAGLALYRFSCLILRAQTDSGSFELTPNLPTSSSSSSLSSVSLLSFNSSFLNRVGPFGDLAVDEMAFYLLIFLDFLGAEFLWRHVHRAS